MGSFVVQILGLLLIKAIFQFFANIILKNEKKRLQEMDLNDRTKSFQAID
jgi:hypothetical protein